ncbi:AfsR/SARP family transcriptional regulator [Nonomuraea mesophila]|uniref:AfsR/SARP family transcriptional regulator n=1 Tax=Nonomuraea mesophila TaxID=2530382 RepID=A0A4R5FU39_9ACTN|nr:AfsR/SARP family transcriptional regulator [Nonomuraea mesophila]TDE57396.1 AfsR/SARP family transcriptional regulator [Nonomuraea mesophila]
MLFKILGPLEVTGPEGDLAIGPPLRRMLLAALIVEGEHLVTQERLADVLWGDDPPSTATKNIQTHVFHLRALLGRERIERRHTGYVLKITPAERDTDVFEQQVRQGRLLVGLGCYKDARVALRRGMAQWRGPLLADLPSRAAWRGAANRLENQKLLVIESLMEAELGLGHYETVVEELSLHLETYPLHERFWTQRMIALSRLGHRSSALMAYEQARQTMNQELGVEPGPELRDLHQKILQS